MRHRLVWTIVILPALVLPAAAAEVTADYICADGTRIVAVFSTAARQSDSVTLRFPASGDRTHLPQAVSADGGRYAAGDTEFWIKGRKASFTRGGATTTCETNQ